MLAETVTLTGARGDIINAYFARPLGPGPFPGLVLAHHLPGWDEWYREIARRFAYHGYAALCPNLYFREGHGTPEDVAAKVRGAGGLPDGQAVGDLAGTFAYLRSLPYVNGEGRRVRHLLGRAPRLSGRPPRAGLRRARQLLGRPCSDTKRRAIAYAANLAPRLRGGPVLPAAGHLRPRGPQPFARTSRPLEAELKQNGKTYEFYRYPNAGHGFFYYDRPSYRQEQAVDGWSKIWAFLGSTCRPNP
jgi:carboxymethylenebutenolidase